ncbi:hypothetical protein LKD27_06945, partial [Faecalibacterium sp. CLA-AA-H283]|uniref:hypothetical protein n=1 Tax=Faecalibacterium TaxID=216851 RepID=UPI001D0E03DE
RPAKAASDLQKLLVAVLALLVSHAACLRQKSWAPCCQQLFIWNMAIFWRLVSHWQAAFFFVKGSFVKMTEKGHLICEYQQKFSKYLILI